MRGGNIESRAVNNTLDTINAAAFAIASAESRPPRAAVQKRRWGSCWSIYLCFGYKKHRKQIQHAVSGLQTPSTGTDISVAENSHRASATAFPFVVPPSSPASFLQSEPPSVTQSPAPAGIFSLRSMSTSMYSPSGPASIFAIGPYAHETQLVSPPVFSAFTTEPSTAPFTPPESIHLTTPSSPEVPFAQLLDPKFSNGETGQRFPYSHHEFQSYQFYPGSPVGYLISPVSGISGSGTSSPFLDNDFTGWLPNSIEFQAGNPPKSVNLEKLSTHDWRSQRGSGSVTPDTPRLSSGDGLDSSHRISDTGLHTHSETGCENDQIIVNHRISFDLTAEDVVRCIVDKKPMLKGVSAAPQATAKREDSMDAAAVTGNKCCIAETSNATAEKEPTTDEAEAQRHQRQHSITLQSIKDFNFDSAKSESISDWWASTKVIEHQGGNTWSFPRRQPGVS